MNGAEERPTTKPGLRCRLQRLAVVGAGTVGLSFVSTITASVVVTPRLVAADQVSGLQAQATQISRDLVLEQLQIDAYQQQYDVDTVKVQNDEAAISASKDQIQADIDRVQRDRRRLQSESVAAYVNLDPEINGGASLFENQKEMPSKTVYEEVASGDIALAIDAVRTDEKSVRANRATLQEQVAQEQATANQAASLLQSANQTKTHLASRQAQVTGQLAAAVAQQQAAQAAAAAAAVQAAQAKAAAAATKSAAAQLPVRTSTPPQGTGVSGTPVATPTGDPTLPRFLQCVLQVESGGNYAAVSPDGLYMGGFQFSQPTWNEAAQLAGMPQLVGVPPNQATPAEQDDLAIALYQADGEQPWNDSCR